MNYLQTILLIVVGSFFAIGGIYILWGTRKSKEIMDVREKRGNIVGSIFLLTIGSILIIWGSFIWHSVKTATPDTVKNNQNAQMESKLDTPEASQEHPQEQNQISSDPIHPDEQTVKEDAKKAVEAFSQIQKSFDDIISAYQTELTNISKGSVELTGSYDVDKLGQQTLTLYEDVQNLEVASQYRHYKDLMLDSVLYLQGSIDDLRTCIIDKKFTLFTDSQNFFQKSLETNRLVNIGVKSQASLDGYTED